MEIGRGAAPGKIILFGEHAVVYGRPALAAPVTQVAATATVEAGPPRSGLQISAPDVGEQVALAAAPPEHPLALAVRLTLAHLHIAGEPDWRIVVRSTVPVASGMGSGAAVSAALVRGLAAAAGETLTPATVSGIVYEVERLHHGTPSGVDNTVIAYGQPVFFVRGQPPEPFAVARPFTLVIADTGVASPTKVAVGDVRAAWQREPARYEALFDAVARIVAAARAVLAAGQADALGPLMNDNHALLRQIGVSCPALERLIAAARDAGAAGAKLSGGGRGGNMIALVQPRTAAAVAAALAAAGATRVLITEVA